MPNPFTILGYGNGFNYCLPMLSKKYSEDKEKGFQTITGIDLKKAMNYYWNMYAVKFSGSAKIDFKSEFYYNRSYDFSTEYDKTIFDDTGIETNVALFPYGNFLIEPKERKENYSYMQDERNSVVFTLKGPFLNDIDFNIGTANIESAIYAFKINFSMDYSLNEILITTGEIKNSAMMLRETIDVKFDTFYFPINIATRYNENTIPDYEFKISDLVPKIYTAEEY